jgi:hypothetical protein
MSVETFSAKPCDVTHRLMWTPMAPIFAPPTQTPVHFGIRPPWMPKSASVSIIVCSMART